ncbi:MAG TPA: universal stress protein, partial [Myxococcales bacterium]|nr:universal stress protein [Myxococcales bacterium]
VKAPPPGAESPGAASAMHLEHMVRLRNWVTPLGLPTQRLSLHVIVAADPAGSLVEFARRNNVDLIVLGAPRPSQQALGWWRSVASGVTANAHCSVHVVRVPESTEPGPTS